MRAIHLVMLFMLLTGSAVAANGVTSGSPHKVMELSVEGAIGPATADYVERALKRASFDGVELVVLRLDTPGGLDESMRSIIKAITNSPVPVAAYVSPTGARAASAGTYILYASHIAAMAPGTNLGAATPVSIGGGFPGGDGGAPQDKGKPAEKPKSAMERKVVNDAVAYIRGLAQLRGRNADWAEQAVREGVSLSADEAVKNNVVDLIAGSTSELLERIDGREVLVQGHRRVLHTRGLPVQQQGPDWRSRLLGVLTNPNIAYILMLIGIYGLIFEFSNPGSVVPGTVGAIALLLALYAFQLLPINYAGVGLILLGVGLMIGEAYQPSFGMLGIGGTVAFIFGSIILIDTAAPGFGIDLSVIITFAVASILMFVIVIGMALKARRRPVVSGMEEMLGGEGVVVADFDERGVVSIHSERWSAHSDVPLTKGQRVKVTAIDGLILHVVPAEEQRENKS